MAASHSDLYVYPTALKAESVAREQARATGCLLGHRVTTFPQLTDAIARDLGVAARVLEPELAAVVLADALERADVPPGLRVQHRGLIRALLDALGELQAACLEPADVAQLAAGLPRGPWAQRVDDLARVYAAYQAGLARLGAVDRHGRDARVCDALAAAERSGAVPRLLAGVRRIVFAELYDFSVLQFLIATSLIRLVGDAELIAFAHPENVDATRFLDRTWNRFVGDPNIADQVLPSFVLREGRQGSLAAALRGAFAAERPAPAPSDGSIRLVEAPSRYREVEAAVRDVRRQLEAGMPAERIALLARDLAVYGDLIEDVCRRYRVPVYFRKGKPLLASGVVRAVVDLVRCVADGYPRAKLEALLDSDYMKGGDAGLVQALRRAGYVAESARPLADCVAQSLAADPRWADRGARAVAFVDLLRPLDGTRSVPDHVSALRHALRRVGFRAVRTTGVAADVIRRDARAWERLDAALTALAGIARGLGPRDVPLAGFLRQLLAILEPQQVEDRAERVGSVRALGVLDARGLDFDVVHLLGLDDGTFPAPRSESPLLPDALKRVLNPLAGAVLRRKLGARGEGLPVGGLLRTAREASLEDPFLFFLALSMPERELVLSWPAADERGNPTVRSPFVDEVVACLDGGPPIERPAAGGLTPAAEECCEPAELIARAALDRWTRPPGAAPDRLTAALRVALPDGPARLAAIDARARIEEHRIRYFLTPPADAAKEALVDAYLGRVGGDPTALRTRLTRAGWSPTRLEKLGACGFKFFAHTLLGLRDDDEPALEVEAREQGTLAHHVLEQFLRAHPQLPGDLEDARALGRRFLDGIRDGAVATIAAKDPHFVDLTWARIGWLLDELIVDVEHPWQEEQTAAGVRLERRLEEDVTLPLVDSRWDVPVVLGGRPDRVELHRVGGRLTRVRVLDYKAARYAAGYGARLDPTKELGRTSFQIPVYLLATLAGLGAEVTADTVAEGGYLLLLGTSKDKKKVEKIPAPLLDPGPGTAEAPSLAERMRALIQGAYDGRFDVNPDPCDQYCAYRGVCRYQPPPLEEEDQPRG